MRSSILSIVALLTVFAGFSSSEAYAASVGDAFRETLNSPNFTYDAKADLELSKGGESDLPFDLHISVHDQGGRTGENLGRNGNIQLWMDNFSDVPASLGDFRVLQGQLDYRMSVLNGSVNYAEVTKANLITDSVEGSKITEMLNQFAKFITGRTFRFSGQEIADLIASESQMKVFGSDEELFLAALTAGKSVDQIVKVFGTFIDGLVTSGILVDEAGSGALRTTNRSGASEIHVLRFGESVTQDGAKQFDQAFSVFLRNLFPGMSNMESTTSAEEINMFLDQANQIGFELKITLAGNRLQSIWFHVNLTAIGVPLVIREEVYFDYSKGFEVFIPQDQNTIVDLNKIFEGMSAIARLSSPNFDSSEQPDWESSLEPAKPGSYDLFLNVQTVCPDYDDRACAKKEIRNQLNWVRNQYTRQEFARLRRELNSMVNQYYY